MFNFFKPVEGKVKTLGQRGEEFSQEYYKKLGFELVESNFFNNKGKRIGELDFIVKNKDTIIFVEVKTRTAEKDRFGSAEEAVNFSKQMKILKTVKLFLNQFVKYQALRPQIDVCLVNYKKLDKNPFSVKIISNAVEDIC